MNEKPRSRRPRIGERRENSEQYTSGQGYKKSYNNNGSNPTFGKGRRPNPRYKSYSSHETDTESYGAGRRTESYGRDASRRPYQDREKQYRKPYSRPNNNGENFATRTNSNPSEQQGRKRGVAPKAKGKTVPTPLLYKAPYSPDEPIRLNKYLSTAGVCSRREADEMILRGEVKVNGVKITELGTKILFGDLVTIKEKVVTPEHKVYVLLNKPKNCVTTMSDPEGRLTVMDLIRKACPERIFPVGRLDRNTTGVLLLTNDGELTSKLTHPQYMKKKIYAVTTDKDVTEEDMQRIADGIELSDGFIHADAISYVNETDKDQIGIEIHSGRNRIVRRIFEALGYKVKKLDRVYFAGLTKKDLPRGRWRYLTTEEVNMLYMGSYE